MIVTIAFVGFLTAVPLALSSGDGLSTDVAAQRAGSSDSADVRCFDPSGKGLSGALQIDGGNSGSNSAPSEEEPEAVPVHHDCALV